MGPIEQLTTILPALCDTVDGITTEQLAAPTPCDEFRVHDVLDHMLTGGGAFAALFRGEDPAGITAPAAYGRVPATEFRAAMDGLLAAVRSEGAMTRTLPTPLGDMDGETFARVVALDGLVHCWDLAAASGQPIPVPAETIAAVDAFARVALTDDLRGAGMFAAATEPSADATPIESLAAFSGRTVDEWRGAAKAIHADKHSLPVKIDIPGAVARQRTAFGDASGYGSIAGEYFTLAAGTDIAPLLAGLERDTCHAPHWGYMLSGAVVVSFVDGSEVTCTGGELFYWPPGHSVRVTEDADIVLFSPETEHVEVLDHMLDRMAMA